MSGDAFRAAAVWVLRSRRERQIQRAGVHTCPSCKAPMPDYLRARWHADSALVDLQCRHWAGDRYRPGCSELEVATAIAAHPVWRRSR